MVSKRDFEEMEVVGQFNLGFIVARLRTDLFIIDQHASDEKFRFETLQRDTRVHTQRLIAPLPLDLAPASVETLLEHRAVFAANGFEVDVVEEGEGARRARLLAVPFSKHVVFGAADVHELCATVADHPEAADSLRLPKFNSMIASRACRSAVMIGTPLTHAEMRRIVRHMAELEQPWNCPHG